MHALPAPLRLLRTYGFEVYFQVRRVGQVDGGALLGHISPPFEFWLAPFDMFESKLPSSSTYQQWFGGQGLPVHRFTLDSRLSLCAVSRCLAVVLRLCLAAVSRCFAAVSRLLRGCLALSWQVFHWSDSQMLLHTWFARVCCFARATRAYVSHFSHGESMLV
jgi:hypothetical protein